MSRYPTGSEVVAASKIIALSGDPKVGILVIPTGSMGLVVDDSYRKFRKVRFNDGTTLNVQLEQIEPVGLLDRLRSELSDS